MSLTCFSQLSDTPYLKKQVKSARKEAHINEVQKIKLDAVALSDSLILAKREDINNIKSRRNKVGKLGFNSALSLESTYGYVLKNSPFFEGKNSAQKAIKSSPSYFLEYSFESKEFTWESEVYGSPYQGIGATYSSFGNKQELGNPWGFYIFQGARISQINSKLSFNYEWNFGLTGGWKPYDHLNNQFNDVVGSKVNAYIGVNLFFKWMVSKYFDIKFGVMASHYSNGNTKTPNLGVNTISPLIGVKYYFNRDTDFNIKDLTIARPIYPRHVEHEILFHAAFHDAVIDTAILENHKKPSPYVGKRFFTAGISYSPMFALGYKFRVGPSLDLSYDEAKGMEFLYDGVSTKYIRAKTKNLLDIGLAAKGDFVMPYFTVSVSLGCDFLKYNDPSTMFYQIYALKIDVTRWWFVNIGYKTLQFHVPQNLMIGIGIRLNSYKP